MTETHKNNSEVTLETLAQMVARGFEETHGQIAGVKERLSGVEYRLGNVEEKITMMHQQIIQLQLEMGEVKDELRRQNYAREIDDLRRRVKILEEKTGN